MTSRRPGARFARLKTMSEECFVCGGSIPEQYDKYDPKAPVYAPCGVYHLGCEDEVIPIVYAEADEE